ncbi:Zinc finger, RING-type [Dillenia turbinata]|uniref:Zinc finger, RING-type n=1 Tax=Dillenia turbinata TaxID=194707 RepID=A0AAN8UHW4_9MAGN
MISLIYDYPRFSTVTLILYACIWIPFLQIKNALVEILGFKYKLGHPWPFEGSDELFAEGGQSCSCSMQLPASRFQDIKLLDDSGIDEVETEKSCAICLTEFGDKDVDSLGVNFLHAQIQDRVIESLTSSQKMISLIYTHPGFGIATLILYTCIWNPFVQIKKALVGFLGFQLKLAMMSWPLRSNDELLADGGKSFCSCSLNELPAEKFQDIKVLDDGRSCSICLTEFEDEDMVTQLSKCRHVFHLDCIQKWIHVDKFTCPICRSFLLSSEAVQCGDCLCNSSSFVDSAQSSLSQVSSLYW